MQQNRRQSNTEFHNGDTDNIGNVSALVNDPTLKSHKSTGRQTNYQTEKTKNMGIKYEKQAKKKIERKRRNSSMPRNCAASCNFCMSEGLSMAGNVGTYKYLEHCSTIIREQMKQKAFGKSVCALETHGEMTL
jgi:hypothetical protein